MHYFKVADNQQQAIEHWQKSQFDLCDIVLSLTDNSIMLGAKIYAIFCRNEVKDVLQLFICDLAKIKAELGIVGDYVERKGNMFDKNFNPKRNPQYIALSREQMLYFANIVYNNIMEDLAEIWALLKN